MLLDATLDLTQSNLSVCVCLGCTAAESAMAHCSQRALVPDRAAVTVGVPDRAALHRPRHTT